MATTSGLAPQYRKEFQIRPDGSIASIGETDPLLAALIGKLPPGGASWPHAKRAAWLELMWKAFDVVYDNDGAVIEMPSFLKATEQAAPLTPTLSPQARGEGVQAADRPFQKMGGHAFYIDKAGRACRAGGAQILPSDLDAGAVLYDMRGEAGDLAAIEWADGKRGVRGLQVDISAA